MRLLVIQHAACEPPGAYEDELRERGIDFERVQIDVEAPPEWRTFDGIVVMGGPMSANDDRELPWLAREKQLIGEAVRAGVPYWGVCLGAQLLAASLGARVHPADRAELGIYRDVELTSAAREDPVFARMRSPITTLQWHGDTFALPEDALLLAGSAACAHQAFVWGRAYGLQFHLEASATLAAEWLEVPAYADELERALGDAALRQLEGELHELDRVTPLARELFGRWIERVVAPARMSALSDR